MLQVSLVLLFFLLILLYVNVCGWTPRMCRLLYGRNRHRIPWRWVTGSFESADVGTMNWTGILSTSSKGCYVTIEPSSLHTPWVLLPQQVLRIPHGNYAIITTEVKAVRLWRTHTLLCQMKSKGRERGQEGRAQTSAPSCKGISTDYQVMKLMLLWQGRD